MNRPTTTAHSVVAAPSQDQPLAQLIADEIRSRGGWMRFERYMELALYAPGLGYYSGGRRVIGQGPQDGSDFVTAPELTPIFGQVLAKQVAQALKATDTREVWEFGAGTGALADQLLGALGDDIDRYTIVDLSGTLRERQSQHLSERHPHLVHKVTWADSLPDTMQGVIVGNEVLDAMPVHLMHWDGAKWLERGVGLSTDEEGALQFVWVDRPAPEGVRPPTDRPDSDFVPGTTTETHGQAEAFVTTLAQRMTRGAAFFLDYGFPESEYYHPQRTGGTLMCHHLHQSDPDPLVMVGQKDITSHVNFTGVALAGQDADWQVLGYTSQGRFLLNCGMGNALKATGQASTVEDLKTRQALTMLLGEHEMGELFKVLGFVKGEWFDAIGFEHGDRSHML